MRAPVCRMLVDMCALRWRAPIRSFRRRAASEPAPFIFQEPNQAGAHLTLSPPHGDEGGGGGSLMTLAPTSEAPGQSLSGWMQRQGTGGSIFSRRNKRRFYRLHDGWLTGQNPTAAREFSVTYSRDASSEAPARRRHGITLRVARPARRIARPRSRDADCRCMSP